MTTKKILSSIGVGAGAIILGLGIQYAVAAWSSAPASPPNSNVAAPINVSGGGENGTATYSQVKTGLLTLNSLAVKYLNIASGTPANGNVLASDAYGNAHWVATSSLGLSGGVVGPPGGGVPSHIVTFNTSTSWTVPSGVTLVRVREWGGGGGGGGSSGASGSGGGGGSGAYAEGVIAIPTGVTSYSLTVGSGGYGESGALKTSTGYGSDGAATAFGSLVKAGGGYGGGDDNLGSSLGGSGGVASLGQVKIKGGNGASSPNGGPVGGNGGNAPIGGEGGVVYAGPGADGSVPGGGGGGAGNAGSTGVGGDGASGMIIIEY